ncbi:MAG: hypothetical protein CL967_05835 [Euryarchaeota archaeon]|nr:hypothetical protein [Euryarchaeota archaeon]
MNGRFDGSSQSGDIMAESLLRLEDIEVRRGKGVVLSQFNLEVHAGDVLVLHGENGSGKSTVIETCARLLSLENGRVFHHGKRVLDSEGRRTSPPEAFGLTLQKNGLVGDETVENHLKTVCFLSEKSFDLTEILASYGLDHRRHDRIAQLSGGQMRKVAVLAGLLPALLTNEPRLILLDEPATGLDEKALESLVNHIGQLSTAGHGFIVASHNSKILECATRIHNLKTEKSNVPNTHEPWKSTATQHSTSLLSARVGFRYLTSTQAAIARNGLTALLVLGTLMGFVDPSSIENRSLLVGFVLAAPFAAGLAGDPVLYIMREGRAVDWWRAQVQRLPSSDVHSLTIGFVFTAIGCIVFLDGVDWRITALGTLMHWVTMNCVRFIELSTLRLVRPNAVFLRLLLPILILPWALVTDFAAGL